MSPRRILKPARRYKEVKYLHTFSFAEKIPLLAERAWLALDLALG